MSEQIDDDFILPFSKRFLSYFDVAKVTMQNYDKQHHTNILNQVIIRLQTIITQSTLVEDIVLISALLYYYKNLTGKDLPIKISSPAIQENVKELLNCDDTNNYKNIFESDKKYLKVILLANFICGFNKENTLEYYKYLDIVQKYKDSNKSAIFKTFTNLIMKENK